MEQMNGRLLPRTLSKVSANSTLTVIAEALLLMLFGALAAVIHARFRVPLRLPGHHGIEFMTIFMFCRQASRFNMATSLSSLGAGMILMIPVLGFKDPFMAFVFFVPGVLLDLLFMAFRRINSNILISGLIAGISYASIPLCREVISLVLGIPYGSLLSGIIYPTATHFIFGFIGGSLGAGVYKLASQKKKTN
ncbi:MAG: hypothetical protein WCM76_01855 [Bacteroidota bacterium]